MGAAVKLRKTAIKVACAYRTMSTETFLVMTGMIPIDLLVKKRTKMRRKWVRGKEVSMRC